jgi:UDP-N-acetyl-2-amino-2-deoxyglucuronate dehydrogenase
MSDTKLKTAILGLEDNGLLLLQAVSSIDLFEIQAVADKDAELAKKISQQYNCPFYDDYRQLVIQNQFDCLFVAAGLYSCEEYVKTAMKKKCNILKAAPLAGNFEQAAELVRLAESENIKFAVANPARFSQSFIDFQQFFQHDRIEQPFLINVFCAAGDQLRPSWKTDPKLAGGGVLLHDCYEIIDRIICSFSVPQLVYSLSTTAAVDRQQRLYLTEDTSVVTMKFNDTFIANIIASRQIKPQQQCLTVYGKDKILTVTNSKFIVSDNLEQVSEKFEYDYSRPACIEKMLRNFALSILIPDENKFSSTARDNLKNMAVIEAAYLSARTGFPEQPAKILKMEQI